MSDVARATRATLAALAGGATPAQALAVGGASCGEGPHRARYAAAAEDLSNDSFRPDVIGRLEWSPPVVGLLLSRAPRAALARVAEAALAASRGPPFVPARPVVRWVTAHLAASAVVVALILRWAFRALPPGPPLDDIDIGLGLGLAAVVAVGLAQLTTRVARRSLTDAQTLRWLIAGELAQVPPGAVLGPLVEQAHPLGRRLLERMRRAVRGTATMRDAIVLWVEDGGLSGPAARLGGLVADGEDSITATERMARLAALDPPVRLDRLLLTASNALTVAAVLVLAQVVFVGGAALWGLDG